MPPAPQVLAVLIAAVSTILAQDSALNNDVLETPRVFCGEDGVRFEIETEKPFVGKIYARNEYFRDTCRASFDKDANLGKGGDFRLNFNECGMRRERMIEPIRGMSYAITVVVQFHSTFVTKADKAFDVRCFYRERTIEVTAQTMDVDQLYTEVISIDHPMPKCTYTIRHKSINGPLATFARVGDPIVHMFTCDNEANNYNILVRDCRVQDAQRNSKVLVDDYGCTRDDSLLSTPEYSSDGMTAYAIATVFKWPDESAVFFSCKLTLCMKDDSECTAKSPPTCGGGDGLGSQTIRRKRQANETSSNSLVADDRKVFDMDLQVRRLMVLDADQIIDPMLTEPTIPGKRMPLINFDSFEVEAPMIFIENDEFATTTATNNNTIEHENSTSTEDSSATIYERDGFYETVLMPTSSTAPMTTPTRPNSTAPMTTPTRPSTKRPTNSTPQPLLLRPTTSTSTTSTTSTSKITTTNANYLHNQDTYNGRNTVNVAAQLTEVTASRTDKALSHAEVQSRVCYGFEYVIGFAVMLSLFVLALSVVTVRLSWPYMSHKCDRWRKLWQLSQVSSSESHSPRQDRIEIIGIQHGSRLNMRYVDLPHNGNGNMSCSSQSVISPGPAPPVYQFQHHPNAL